jgi:hypothetical protein
MAIPLIGSGIAMLMRRYGLKGLAQSGKKEAFGKARGQLGKSATNKKVISKAKSNIRKDSAWNAVGDASTVALGAEAIGAGMDLDKYKDKESLEKFIKNEKPKLWKQYSESSFDDIKQFLKSMKGK